MPLPLSKITSSGFKNRQKLLEHRAPAKDYLDSLGTYKSDDDARYNGVKVGGYYKLSEPNDYRIPGGMIKQVLIPSSRVEDENH